MWGTRLRADALRRASGGAHADGLGIIAAAIGNFGSFGNFGSLTRVNKIPAKQPFSHVKTPFSRFQSRHLSQNPQDSQSSQGSQENAGYVSGARVCVSASFGASGGFIAAGGVRSNRAPTLSIRVTGPIAKTRSLIRQKSRVRVTRFAVERCRLRILARFPHPPTVNRGRPRRCRQA